MAPKATETEEEFINLVERRMMNMRQFKVVTIKPEEEELKIPTTMSSHPTARAEAIPSQ